MASPRVRADEAAPPSPARRRIDARWARWATCARSASTGAAYGITLSTDVPATWATDSGVSPARIRAWMSRGRRVDVHLSLQLAGPCLLAARSRALVGCLLRRLARYRGP